MQSDYAGNPPNGDCRVITAEAHSEAVNIRGLTPEDVLFALDAVDQLLATDFRNYISAPERWEPNAEAEFSTAMFEAFVYASISRLARTEALIEDPRILPFQLALDIFNRATELTEPPLSPEIFNAFFEKRCDARVAFARSRPAGVA